MVRLRNTGPAAERVAQVAVNQSLWDFAISPGVRVPGGARALLSLYYPWDAGFPVEIKVITSKGKSFAHRIPSPAATPSRRVSDEDRGAAVYVERCYPCHGSGGGGDGPRGVYLGRKVPDLREGVSRKTDAEIGRVISDGKGWMPAFKFALTESERRSVLKFVRSFR
ncbi:MAG: c-type cytochrome [Nitrospinota bacterium]